MSKTRITKEDAKTLDDIIELVLNDLVLNKPASFVGNFPPLGNESNRGNEEEREIDYEPYLEILKEFGVAEVISSDDRATQVKALSLRTQRFKDNGGFRKVYEEQLQQEKREARTEDREIDEAFLVKWQRYTYWPTFLIAIAGFIMALIALIKS